MTTNLEKYKKAIGSEKLSLEKRSIDNRGYSPEAAEILGKDYMKDRMIIISPEQKTAACIKEGYSFMPVLMNEFYNLWQDKLELFLDKDLLIGSLKIEVKKENELAKIEVYSEFDTLNNDVKEARKLISDIEAISENPKLILKKK